MPFHVVKDADLSINSPCYMPFISLFTYFKYVFIINEYVNEYNVSILHFSSMYSKKQYIVFVYTIRSNFFLLLMFYSIDFYFVKKKIHNY